MHPAVVFNVRRRYRVRWPSSQPHAWPGRPRSSAGKRPECTEARHRIATSDRQAVAPILWLGGGASRFRDRAGDRRRLDGGARREAGAEGRRRERAAEEAEYAAREAAEQNAKEVAHAVSVSLAREPGVALFTVTRTFEARAPSAPISIDGMFDIPEKAVVTSFAILVLTAAGRG